MSKFAKLYETEFGQILVKMDSDDDYCPEVRFYFKPKNLGVCSVAVQFKDTDDGWDRQENYFAEITSESASIMVAGAIEEMPGL